MRFQHVAHIWAWSLCPACGSLIHTNATFKSTIGNSVTFLLMMTVSELLHVAFGLLHHPAQVQLSREIARGSLASQRPTG